MREVRKSVLGQAVETEAVMAETVKKPRRLTLREIMDVMAEDEGLSREDREKAAEISQTLKRKPEGK